MAKSLISASDQENDFIHSPFHPATIRTEDRTSAVIIADKKCYPLELWEYSPFGVTLIDHKKDVPIKKGDQVSLKLRFNNRDEVIYDGVMVGSITNGENKIQIGIRTFYKEDSSNAHEEKRLSHRWSCPEGSLPTGTAANPLQYNDYIFFRIEDFSSGGIRFLTSMRNKHLYKGMKLDSTISLPLIGSIIVTLELVYIEVVEKSGKQFMSIGARFLNKDETTLSSIAEYLLNFGQNVSTRKLKEEGFILGEMSKYFDFGYVKSESEYQEVLRVRYEAYNKAGKLPEGTTVGDMADEHDAKSRILTVKFKGELVGTARLTYHDSWEVSYYGKYINNKEFSLKAKDCVEVTKLCIIDNKRGSDIFQSILSHLVLTSIKSSRNYIIGGAAGHLLNFYKEHGFKASNLTYESSQLNSLKHQIIYMDIPKVARCENISIKRWYRTFYKVIDFMIEKEIISLSRADLLKINFFKKLGKLRGY